ncbi:MAG: hypothetical protein S4CHLAM20_13210 [Chlamydiia bacterium]|nr:hypothetical protein [Chlamydiia bacterium]
MSKAILGLRITSLFMTTTLFGSGLFTSKDGPDGPPPRETFLDFYVESDPPGTSITLGINLSATQISLNSIIGNRGHQQDGAQSIQEGSSISFDNNPLLGIGAVLMASNAQAGQIIFAGVDYYKQTADPSTTYASQGSEIQLISPITESTNSTDYSNVTHSMGFERVAVRIGVGSFSIQYKGFGISSKFGLALDYINMNTSVAGTESTSLNVNTQTGTQETYAGGILGGLKASLVLTSTDDTSFIVATEVDFSKELASNDGCVQRFTRTPADITTYTLNTQVPDWSTQSTLIKTLSFIYTSTTSVQTSATSLNSSPFVSIKLGLGQEELIGTDQIASVIYGTEGTVTTTFIYGAIIYTM